MSHILKMTAWVCKSSYFAFELHNCNNWSGVIFGGISKTERTLEDATADVEDEPDEVPWRRTTMVSLSRTPNA